MARPRKEPEEKYVKIGLRWPRELAERLRAAVPERQRGEFIRQAVEWALKREERERRRLAKREGLD